MEESQTNCSTAVTKEGNEDHPIAVDVHRQYCIFQAQLTGIIKDHLPATRKNDLIAHSQRGMVKNKSFKRFNS